MRLVAIGEFDGSEAPGGLEHQIVVQRQLQWTFEGEGVAEAFAGSVEDADGVILLPGFASQPGGCAALAEAIRLGKQVFALWKWDDPKPLRRIS